MKVKDLRLIELELHSYCNRTCNWCPNSFIDRKSDPKFINFNVLGKLLEELRVGDFKGIISLSRYNEPFSIPGHLEVCLRLIKDHLPDVKLVANTNGDFDYFSFKNRIEITEMDYDNKKEEVIKDNFRIMKLQNIGNRGGALSHIKKDFVRDFPCKEPYYFVGINYDGTVSPCCNIRNDIPAHKSFIMGDLNNDTLENILNNSKSFIFRGAVANIGFDKNVPLPCRGCDKLPGRYTRDNPDIGGDTT